MYCDYQQIGIKHETRQAFVIIATPLDQLRERIHCFHYSLNTEKVYVYWVRFFIRWCTDRAECGIQATWVCGRWRLF